MEVKDIDLLKKLKEANIELRANNRNLQRENAKLHKENGDLKKINKNIRIKLQEYGLGRNNGHVNSTTNSLIKPYQIQAVIERVFDLPYKGIFIKSQSPKYALPRQYYIYFVRKHTPLSQKKIGKDLGGYDRTTILHAEKKINRLVFEIKKPEAVAIYEKIEKQLEYVANTGKVKRIKKKRYANHN